MLEEDKRAVNPFLGEVEGGGETEAEEEELDDEGVEK